MNGVAAVETAIKILNDLPSASQLVLTNYPLVVTGTRYTAANLIDLKSETLALLLEHMGLASPTRYIYVIRQWDASLLTASSLLCRGMVMMPIPSIYLQRLAY